MDDPVPVATTPIAVSVASFVDTDVIVGETNSQSENIMMQFLRPYKFSQKGIVQNCMSRPKNFRQYFERSLYSLSIPSLNLIEVQSQVIILLRSGISCPLIHPSN